MKIEQIDLKQLREQMSNWRAWDPVFASDMLDALGPQVVALIDEIFRLRTDVDLRGPDGACCRARHRAEDQLIAMTQARNAACEWWEAHLKGFEKRQGEPDGGAQKERACLERIKRVGQYMEDVEHRPLVSVDHAWVVGCSCGWLTPPGTTDSETAIARHLAIVSAGYMIQCECGAQFDSRPAAIAHAKEQLHHMRGLFFAERLDVEKHFHAYGVCTHVPQTLDGGIVTMCAATTPVTKKDDA
jgi:hypothetical protein